MVFKLNSCLICFISINLLFTYKILVIFLTTVSSKAVVLLFLYSLLVFAPNVCGGSMLGPFFVTKYFFRF